MTQSQEETQTYKIVANDIKQYVSLVGQGIFSSNQIDRQFNYASRDAKRYRWQVLDNLVKEGILESGGVGKYRKVEKRIEEIDWQSANLEDIVKLVMPLNLHKYVKIHHKSIIIVAGSPGAGKTAFLYDFILRNMGAPMETVLFTNDMSPEEINERIRKSEIEVPNHAPFKVYDRADNFADVIEPDKINVVDYLDLNSEVYLVGDEIEKIYRKLNKGIAVIALQKKVGQQLAIGGVFTIKRAKLYISIDTIKEAGNWIHKLSIQKARGRVDPKIDPRTVEIKFKLLDGIRFISI